MSDTKCVEPLAARNSPAILSQAALLKGLSYNDLPVEFVTRILEDSAGGSEYKRIANCSAIVTRPANSSWLGSCCASLFCSIGFLVQDGNLGVMRENADFHFLAPGYHAYPMCGREVGPSVSLTAVNTPATFGTLGFLNVAEGSLGLIMVGSTYKLLAPGIYQWHAPNVKFVKTAGLQDTEVSLGPYKLITVPEGSVAVTFHNGNLRILGAENCGREEPSNQRRTFFLDDVKWTFSCMLPTVMQTDRLEGNDLLSKDNVELLMVAMSQWRIVDPVLAVTHCAPDMEKIRSKVNQLVRATIARIVAGTNIGSGPVSGSLARPIVTGIAVDSPAAPATPSAPSSRPDADLAHLMQSEQATKHMRELTAQMAAMGIDVLGVYVPEKRMKNDDIRSQIASQAVIGIRAEAERAAADAKAYATVKAARAQAEAIEVVAAAHAEAGRRLGEPEGTSARLALSESMSKSLKDARLTIFSGAPSTIPFMFTSDPATTSTRAITAPAAAPATDLFASNM